MQSPEIEKTKPQTLRATMTNEELKEFYFHHIMRAYECTEQGLINLLQSGLIDEKEFAQKSVKNFDNYKQVSKEFAWRHFGKNWRKKLHNLKKQINDKDNQTPIQAKPKKANNLTAQRD